MQIFHLTNLNLRVHYATSMIVVGMVLKINCQQNFKRLILVTYSVKIC